MERTRSTSRTRDSEDQMLAYQTESLKQGKPVTGGATAHYIVIGLLVIASFMLGSLYTKVQFLQNGNNGSALPSGNNQPTNPTANAPQAVPTVGEIQKISNRDYIRGNKNAQIALIEYSDYECPYCQRFHPTMQQVIKEYGDKVMWVYRHYPLDFHVNAQKESEAAECIAEQGGNDAFWKFTDTIYTRTQTGGTGFALDKLAPLVKELGYDDAKFQTCLDSNKYAQYVKDQRDGGTKAGVTGTPGTIILDTKSGKTSLIPGALPYEQVKPMIDAILKG